MDTFEEFLSRLEGIRNSGYFRTTRAGNTGVGKTLEDLLEIRENNVPGPDACGDIELKSTRHNSTSMITLFTKSPDPRGVNTQILNDYGYDSARGNGRLELHTTVNAVNFNNIRGNRGFKININEELGRLELLSPNEDVCGYWNRGVSRNSFEAKLPNLVFVKATSRGSGSNEEFDYNEAWLLSNFSFDEFIDLISERIILVDIRIGQYSNGRTHDHGTAFRMFEANLDKCFQERYRIF